MKSQINGPKLNRRRFLAASGALALSTGAFRCLSSTEDSSAILKTIPVTGEKIPAIGMGTWITFNVGGNTALRDARAEVLRAFFDNGGALIDSSPMYGSAEEVLGYTLNKTQPEKLFAATKTWTNSSQEARQQWQDSQVFWGQSQFGLLQVHNLVGWQQHLPWLREMKQSGAIRYLGITTSHGRRHEEVERILRSEQIDFVQLTYNVVDREVERRLLPLAQDKGVAVICNRPFQGGRLPRHAASAKIPEWASEIKCYSWPQLLLKYLIAAPGVTVAIPATSQVVHMNENMQAMFGPLPDTKMRNAIVQAFNAI